MENNVVIIGGGPAGLSAALYLARAGLSPIVLAGSPAGGQLILTSEVENYPGFESILGPELIEKMRKHAQKFGAMIVDENVVKVDFSRPPHKTYTSNKTYESNAIVIATGARALWLGLESEQRLRGKGVSACAVCDGFFFRDKTVAVVGGGDTAMEEALTLTKFAKKVYIIHRRDQFRASKIMRERAIHHPKIEIILSTIVEEIIGEKKVEGVKLKILDPRSLMLEKITNIKHLSSNIYYLATDGVFIAIGHKPDTEVFTSQVELDSKGYIITSARKAIDNSKFLINLISNKAPSTNDQKLGIVNLLGQLDQLEIRNFNFSYQSATSVDGIFAAGDCVDHQYRQAGTAVGMGIAAALDVERYLREK